MGDPNEDISFMTMQQIGGSDERTNSVDKMLLNSSEEICIPHNDILGIHHIEGQVQVEKIVISEEKQAGVSNEEGNVESPSTGELFIYKCVFCERNLTAADDPKLLECLHNACGSCINNKLYEQTLTNLNSKVRIECAACSLMCDPDKLIDNQFLLELAVTDDSSGKITEIKCSSCSDDAIAVSFCIDCSNTFVTVVSKHIKGKPFC